MRKTKCVDCGREIVVESVRGPMPERCPECRRKRADEQKKAYHEQLKKAGARKKHVHTAGERMSRKSLAEMSPVRRRIEMRRRANKDYYSYCPNP